MSNCDKLIELVNDELKYIDSIDNTERNKKLIMLICTINKMEKAEFRVNQSTNYLLSLSNIGSMNLLSKKARDNISKINNIISSDQEIYNNVMKFISEYQSSEEL